MRTYICNLVFIALLQATGHVQAQVAGSTTIGVVSEQIDAVALGWSTKRQILGRTVYNESGQNVGTIDDVIVSPDRTLTVAIVGVGGLIGVRWHQVAIPIDQFSRKDASFVLPGATKALIKSLPVFRYASDVRNAPPVGTPTFAR